MTRMFAAYGPADGQVNVWRRFLATLCLLAACAGVAQAAQPIRILALGDSLTAGYGLPAEDSFPVRLQAALGQHGIDAEVINAGVSGDTTAGGLARLDWALADRPTHALVELGANDALRGIDPQIVRDNLDRILTRLQAAGVTPMLLGMKAPGNWGPAYVGAFDRIYPDLAARHHIPLYPFFLDGVALDPKFDQADMLHPNAAGVDVIVARLLPAVARFLGRPL